MLNEARTKSYPENYPSDAMAILDAMSFSGGKDVKILGSMSLRSQQYAGDYDAYEIVKRKGAVENVLDDLASEFQTIIKNLRGMKNVYIGDIKAGSIEDWRVIPLDAGLVNGKIVGYNPTQSKAKVDELYKAKVINEGEKRSAYELLKDASTPEDFLIARKKLKFHIIRWSVSEVLNGSKVVRGRSITLQEAFSSPVITKLDTIGFVQNNKYTDFSIIYEFHDGEKVLNPSFEDIGRSLSEDIIFYKAENNPFKVLKREFALAKFRGDTKTIKGLTPVLNSDLGRLYSLLSDVKTLIQLLEEKQNVPLEKVRYEIDQFKARMANVYSLPDFLKTEHTLLGHIASALKTTSKSQLLTHLQKIEQLIQASLTHNTTELRGGAEIDVGHLPPPDASRDAATKTKIANKLASELKNAAHYFAYRAPATSLGYRTIADELYKQVPTLSGKPPRDLDEGHAGQTKLQMGRVIWGDQIPNRPKGTKTEFFSNVYKREVEPHFASVKASNPSMTHNEVQAYLEKNI